MEENIPNLNDFMICHLETILTKLNSPKPPPPLLMRNPTHAHVLCDVQ